MAIDLTSRVIEQATRVFENHSGLILIVFAAAILAFIFRRYIAFYLDLSQREENILAEKALFIAIAILIATTGYLYIKQNFFLLSLIISVILTYFLYLLGFFDMLIEKLEGRYGK